MSDKPSSILMITLHRSIWRITRDGLFFGDYRSKEGAVEGAQSAARAMRDLGYAVQVKFAEPGAP